MVGSEERKDIQKIIYIDLSHPYIMVPNNVTLYLEKKKNNVTLDFI